MTEFVTVSRQDAQFLQLLNGKFSRTHFAQPVRSLHVNSDQETVTFRIVEKPSLSLFNALAQWYSAARTIYLLFPLLGALAFLSFSHGTAPLALVVCSLLALQCFLMAMTLYNDYSDYLSGFDRINDNNLAKPLMLGLVRPYQARRLSLLFLALAGLSATYCFVAKPQTIGFGILALAIGYSICSARASRHLKVISVFTTFLLAGPLLVLGYEYLLFETMTWGSALLGGVFGLHALKYDFAKQMRDVFYSSKAKVVTLSTLFGFERSKLFYHALSVSHLVLLSAFCWQVSYPEIYGVVVVAFCFEAAISRLLREAPSFLSSNLSYALNLQKLHFTIESCLIVFVFLRPQWLSLL